MTTPPTPSPKALVAGRVLSGLVIAFLLFDAGVKIAKLPIVGETAIALGWPGDPGLWAGLGWLLLACTALYAWPRTAFVGAILLTAWIGGAVATHVRIGNPLFSHTLFGVYLAVMLWAGLWLRFPAMRLLVHPFPARS